MFIVAAGPGVAAEDLGVKIYPGAIKDEQWSQVQAEFNQKEGFNLSLGQVTLAGAMLQKGEKLSMTIKHMNPLDSTNDARFCIGKKEGPQERGGHYALQYKT